MIVTKKFNTMAMLGYLDELFRGISNKEDGMSQKAKQTLSILTCSQNPKAFLCCDNIEAKYVFCLKTETTGNT